MSEKSMKKHVAIAVGAALATSFAAVSIAQASSPFAVSSLASAYMSAGEGSCGGNKGSEGKCGGDKGAEGSCGGDKGAEGKCGGDKGAEGKCGEGKCGGSM
jgi:uncharacterized low-complexity protein